jgi:glycosyltransferase involved in cell wall biosynthesis
MSQVCVVIPCYKYGRYLRECVRSVLDDQPGSDVRVLIIDDASPDGSADVARQLAAADHRIEVLVHPENRGHIATFNEGIMEWADGDYCVLLSADDMLTPGALRRATEFLDAQPHVGFAYGHVVIFQQDAPLPTARTDLRGMTIWPGRSWLGYMFRAADNPIATAEVVVRTSLQHQVGPYDPSLPHTSDLAMWLRLAVHADVGFIRADQAYYRRHASNMSSDYATPIEGLRERRRAYDALLERGGLTGADGLADLVHRRFAQQALRAANRAYDRRGADPAVDELEAFAFDSWPAAARLPAYVALQCRRRLGPELMSYLRPITGSEVRHDFMEWRRWRSVRHSGIWPRVMP